MLHIGMKNSRIFTLNEMKSKKFKIKVIADSSFDIEGLIAPKISNTNLHFMIIIPQNEIQKNLNQIKM